MIRRMAAVGNLNAECRMQNAECKRRMFDACLRFCILTFAF
jgi:hypothetical protein